MVGLEGADTLEQGGVALGNLGVRPAPLGTAFTVSIDYRIGLTTGISAEERSNTVRALANANAGAEGIFPLIGRAGGVLVRTGHTEAAIDLARLAGLPPVGVLAELVDDDGTVKRLPLLRAFAARHRLKMISVADLVAYRQRREQLVERVGRGGGAAGAGILSQSIINRPCKLTVG